LKHAEIYGRVTLIWILEKNVYSCRLDENDSEYSSDAKSSEHGSETSGSIRGGEYFDELNDQRFLKKNRIPWNYLTPMRYRQHYTEVYFPLYREERMPVYVTPSAVIKWINGVDVISAQTEIGSVTPHRDSIAKHDDGAYFLRHVLKNTNVNDRTTSRSGSGLLPQNSELNPRAVYVGFVARKVTLERSCSSRRAISGFHANISSMDHKHYPRPWDL
jgi:hypothetical protein